MLKVLILGSRGLLGSELVKQFSKDYEVIGWDREDVNLTDHFNTERKIIELVPQIVINATAYNGVDLAETDAATFDLAQRINALAVGNLAKVCKSLDIPLTHFSTEYVFDGTKEKGYKEDDLVNPVNKYGMTKAWGEKLLQENTDKFYLVRLSRMFGKPGTSEGAKKSFVDIMIDLAENQKKTEIKLVAEEASCPTYSVDLANFVLRLFNDSQPFGIYHGANEGACTWYDLGKKVLELKKLPPIAVPIKSVDYPRPAQRPRFSKLINSKLKKQRSWEKALEEYLGL